MSMNLIVISGYLGMVVAVVHGYLGETKVVRQVDGIPLASKRVLQAIMFLSAVYWFAGGLVLAGSPLYLTSGGQRLAALIVGAMFLSGAIGNFWAMRGRHIGWVLLMCATALAWLGAWFIQ